MKHLTAYQVFLKKGLSDLKAALKLLEFEDIESDVICFHFQQFIEKYLKAFLIYHDFEPKKIHDLVLLLEHCKSFEPEFIKFIESELIDLSDCGVFIRYDDIEEIDRDFLNNILPILKDFKNFVESKMNIQLY